jgi:hypothetical protein
VLCSGLVETIASDIEHPVQPRSKILEGNLRTEFQQLLFIELCAQLAVEIVGDIRWRGSHCVGEFDQQLLDITEDRQIIAFECQQLVVRQTGFSAHGRIDVYSKRTPNAYRRSHLCQLDMTQGDAALPAQSGFHADSAPHQAGQPHLHFCRCKVLAESATHDGVHPAQVPRCLFLLDWL